MSHVFCWISRAGCNFHDANDTFCVFGSVFWSEGFYTSLNRFNPALRFNCKIVDNDVLYFVAQIGFRFVLRLHSPVYIYPLRLYFFFPSLLEAMKFKTEASAPSCPNDLFKD